MRDEFFQNTNTVHTSVERSNADPQVEVTGNFTFTLEMPEGTWLDFYPLTTKEDGAEVMHSYTSRSAAVPTELYKKFSTDDPLKVVSVQVVIDPTGKAAMVVRTQKDGDTYLRFKIKSFPSIDRDYAFDPKIDESVQLGL